MAQTAFMITEAASIEIRSRLQSSGLDEAIASMLDTSQSFSPSADLLKAISQNLDNSEMLSIAMKEFRDREPTLKMRLDVGIYDVDKCPPEHRAEIGGIPFVVPPAPLADFALDYVEGQFVLRRGDQTYRRLTEALGAQGAI